MAKINTVLGPINSADLGFTLMHEHILVGSWSMRQAFPDWVNIDELVEEAAEELRAARLCGVQAIVDVTPVNAGRDIHLLREVADRAEVHIIAATGLFWYEEPWLVGWDVDRLVDFLIRDIEVGIQGTDSKAGIIKAATDEAGVTPINRKSLQIVARLHLATGLPITTHTSAAPGIGLAQQDVFEEEGVDLGRVVIGHCGDTEDIECLEAILRRGSLIGMDRFGNELILSDARRVSTVAELCRRGWAGRMVVSHDRTCYLDWFPKDVIRAIAPGRHFSHIPADILPGLREAGVCDADIQLMTVANPADILGGE